LKKHFLFILFISLFFTGCYRVGPEFQKPKGAKIPKEWKEEQNSSIAIKWWQLFKDEKLNKLVD